MRVLLKTIITVLVTFTMNKEAYANNNAVNLELSLETDYNTLSFDNGEEKKVDSDFKFLFVDGELIKDAEIISKNDLTYIPIRVISKIYNLPLIWNEHDNSITLSNRDKLTFRLGSNIATKEVYISSSKSKEVELDGEVILINNLTYVPLRSIFTYFDSKITYYDSKSKNGIGIVESAPNIIIDKINPGYKIIATKDEAFEIIKTKLNSIYEKFTSNKDFIYDTEETYQESLLDYIKEDLNNTYYIGEVSRYYIFLNTNKIIFDMFTGDVFFEIYKENNSYLHKLDETNYILFMSTYFAG